MRRAAVCCSVLQCAAVCQIQSTGEQTGKRSLQYVHTTLIAVSPRSLQVLPSLCNLSERKSKRAREQEEKERERESARARAKGNEKDKGKEKEKEKEKVKVKTKEK